MTKDDHTFAELLSLIEGHRKEWLENAPVASDVEVSRRSESLTVRLTKEEDEALDLTAKRLGIAKSSLLRVMLRHYLGLGRDSSEGASLVRSKARSGMVMTGVKVMRDGRYSGAAKSGAGALIRRAKKASK